MATSGGSSYRRLGLGRPEQTGRTQYETRVASLLGQLVDRELPHLSDSDYLAYVHRATAPVLAVPRLSLPPLQRDNDVNVAEAAEAMTHHGRAAAAAALRSLIARARASNGAAAAHSAAAAECGPASRDVKPPGSKEGVDAAESPSKGLEYLESALSLLFSLALTYQEAGADGDPATAPLPAVRPGAAVAAESLGRDDRFPTGFAAQSQQPRQRNDHAEHVQSRAESEARLLMSLQEELKQVVQQELDDDADEAAANASEGIEDDNDDGDGNADTTRVSVQQHWQQQLHSEMQQMQCPESPSLPSIMSYLFPHLAHDLGQQQQQSQESPSAHSHPDPTVVETVTVSEVVNNVGSALGLLWGGTPPMYSQSPDSYCSPSPPSLQSRETATADPWAAAAILATPPPPPLTQLPLTLPSLFLSEQTDADRACDVVSIEWDSTTHKYARVSSATSPEGLYAPGRSAYTIPLASAHGSAINAFLTLASRRARIAAMLTAITAAATEPSGNDVELYTDDVAVNGVNISRLLCVPAVAATAATLASALAIADSAVLTTLFALSQRLRPEAAATATNSSVTDNTDESTAVAVAATKAEAAEVVACGLIEACQMVTRVMNVIESATDALTHAVAVTDATTDLPANSSGRERICACEASLRAVRALYLATVAIARVHSTVGSDVSSTNLTNNESGVARVLYEGLSNAVTTAVATAMPMVVDALSSTNNAALSSSQDNTGLVANSHAVVDAVADVCNVATRNACNGDSDVLLSVRSRLRSFFARATAPASATADAAATIADDTDTGFASGCLCYGHSARSHAENTLPLLFNESLALAASGALSRLTQGDPRPDFELQPYVSESCAPDLSVSHSSSVFDCDSARYVPPYVIMGTVHSAVVAKLAGAPAALQQNVLRGASASATAHAMGYLQQGGDFLQCNTNPHTAGYFDCDQSGHVQHQHTHVNTVTTAPMAGRPFLLHVASVLAIALPSLFPVVLTASATGSKSHQGSGTHCASGASDLGVVPTVVVNVGTAAKRRSVKNRTVGNQFNDTGDDDGKLFSYSDSDSESDFDLDTSNTNANIQHPPQPVPVPRGCLGALSQTGLAKATVSAAVSVARSAAGSVAAAGTGKGSLAAAVSALIEANEAGVLKPVGGALTSRDDGGQKTGDCDQCAAPVCMCQGPVLSQRGNVDGNASLQSYSDSRAPVSPFDPRLASLALTLNFPSTAVFIDSSSYAAESNMAAATLQSATCRLAPAFAHGLFARRPPLPTVVLPRVINPQSQDGSSSSGGAHVTVDVPLSLYSYRRSRMPPPAAAAAGAPRQGSGQTAAAAAETDPDTSAIAGFATAFGTHTARVAANVNANSRLSKTATATATAPAGVVLATATTAAVAVIRAPAPVAPPPTRPAVLVHSSKAALTPSKGAAARVSAPRLVAVPPPPAPALRLATVAAAWTAVDGTAAAAILTSPLASHATSAINNPASASGDPLTVTLCLASSRQQQRSQAESSSQLPHHATAALTQIMRLNFSLARARRALTAAAPERALLRLGRARGRTATSTAANSSRTVGSVDAGAKFGSPIAHGRKSGVQQPKLSRGERHANSITSQLTRTEELFAALAHAASTVISIVEQQWLPWAVAEPVRAFLATVAPGGTDVDPVSSQSLPGLSALFALAGLDSDNSNAKSSVLIRGAPTVSHLPQSLSEYLAAADDLVNAIAQRMLCSAEEEVVVHTLTTTAADSHILPQTQPPTHAQSPTPAAPPSLSLSSATALGPSASARTHLATLCKLCVELELLRGLTSALHRYAYSHRAVWARHDLAVATAEAEADAEADAETAASARRIAVAAATTVRKQRLQALRSSLLHALTAVVGRDTAAALLPVTNDWEQQQQQQQQQQKQKQAKSRVVARERESKPEAETEIVGVCAVVRAVLLDLRCDWIYSVQGLVRNMEEVANSVVVTLSNNGADAYSRGHARGQCQQQLSMTGLANLAQMIDFSGFYQDSIVDMD